MESLNILQKELTERLTYIAEGSDERIHQEIDELILGKDHCRLLTLPEKLELHKLLFASVRGLDILQDLVDDPLVTEIMVNGPNEIFVEKDGKIRRYDRVFSGREKLEDVVQRIVGNCNRVVNESSPIVDARLDNGSRVNVVVEPACIGGPVLTIRRFPDEAITMEKLIEFGSLSREAGNFLRRLVECGYSILIGGGTSSGKTTFLNALSNYIPSDERVITIEDTAELQIQGIENLVRLEARSANMEGGRTITIRDLIKAALRMRPSRIIVGEVRGDEAIDLLQAWNTGHEGSLGTAHANSARDMVSRLETMVLMGMDLPLEAIRRQIASGVNIMVHLGRRRDGRRCVMDICEVKGFLEGDVELASLYVWDEEAACLMRKNELEHTEKMDRKLCYEN